MSIVKADGPGYVSAPLCVQRAFPSDASEPTQGKEHGARHITPNTFRVAALVLAAGQSSRMGADNKLLKDVQGVPMILHSVNAALASQIASVTVVVGHQAEAVEAILAGYALNVVTNPRFAQGMSTSLRCGIDALPSDSDAVVVLLADMPQITAAHVDTLIEAFSRTTAIIVPMKAGRRGNPVLWPQRHFAAMRELGGDKGARSLLERFASDIVAAEVDSDAIFMDIDTPDLFAALRL